MFQKAIDIRTSIEQSKILRIAVRIKHEIKAPKVSFLSHIFDAFRYPYKIKHTIGIISGLALILQLSVVFADKNWLPPFTI